MKKINDMTHSQVNIILVKYINESSLNIVQATFHIIFPSKILVRITVLNIL